MNKKEVAEIRKNFLYDCGLHHTMFLEDIYMNLKFYCQPDICIQISEKK